MFVLWLLCACCASASAASAPNLTIENTEEYFKDFMTKFEKSYTGEDKEKHFQVFKSNLEIINQLNSQSEDAVFGITKYTDLTKEERDNACRCLVQSNLLYSSAYGVNCEYRTDENIHDEEVPDSFDWRTQNAVTAVEYQRNCKSCYAFSAVGHLEGQYAIKHKELIPLSVQQIIDCNYDGCRGGMISDAFKKLIELGGSMRAKDYPYEATKSTCRTDSSKVVANVTSCFRYKLKSQEKLKQLLYKKGPIPVGIRSSGLFFYTKNILTDSACSNGLIDHAVLLVGYGKDAHGKAYWIAKNTEGESWGESGYFRMQRGENVQSCGMMTTVIVTAEVS